MLGWLLVAWHWCEATYREITGFNDLSYTGISEEEEMLAYEAFEAEAYQQWVREAQYEEWLREEDERYNYEVCHGWEDAWHDRFFDYPE